MKRLSVLLAVFLLSAVPVYADGYEFEGGFTVVNLDDGGVDVNLRALYGSAGYRWDHPGSYSSSVEVKVLSGVDYDDSLGISIELGPSYSVGYKGAWRTSSDDLSFFWRASYANIEIKVTGFGQVDLPD